MRDIADDRHAQAFECSSPVQNRQRVQQRLRRMFVRTVACIHNRYWQVARQEMRSTGSGVAHHNRIRAHRAQRIQRVDQRFAF